ncbi:MAG: hypothetical protein CML43_06290 [Rhodobacteraceae bacterium]|nr:hypothetical protein [Paracoccaceae bacterium]
MTDPDPAPKSAAAPDPELVAALVADIRARAPFRDPGEAAIPDKAAAYAVQAAVVAALAPDHGGIGGRKIAWNWPDQIASQGLGEPAAACVLADMIVPSGVALEAADYRSFAIEPEIAAVLKAPLAPREGGHDRASAAAAVGRFHPAFEFLDPRAGKAPRPFAIVAQNINSRGLALGGPGLTPDEVDDGFWTGLRSLVTQDGETILDVTPGWPMHPLDSVAFLANRFNALGQTLAAGETLLLGTHLPPRPIAAPASLRFEAGALGAVAFTLA